jgi:hypothetical protein
VQPDADLLQVVVATGSPRRFAGSLHGRQQQCDQDADDCDDHQQLDEREREISTTTHRHGRSPVNEKSDQLTRSQERNPQRRYPSDLAANANCPQCAARMQQTMSLGDFN